MTEVVQLYEAGYSLSAIEKKLGIAWDSVARLLDKAGVRERRNKSR
jgi:transposase-like protein